METRPHISSLWLHAAAASAVRRALIALGLIFALALSASALPLPPLVTSSLVATGTYGAPFTYTITGSNSPTSFNATGLPTGLAVDTVTGKITGTPTQVGIFPIVISAKNSVASGLGALVLTVGKGNVIITGITADKTYDGTTAAVLDTTNAVLSGLLPADLLSIDLNGLTGSYDDPNAGSGKTVTLAGIDLSGLGGSKYTVSLPSITGSIEPATLTVTASVDQSKILGSSDPALGYTISGGSLVSGDALTGLLTRVTGEVPGLYNILIGTLTGGPNYLINFISNKFGILSAAAPTVVSTGVPANGKYTSGQALDFTVTFSENVAVAVAGGTPRLPISLDTGGQVFANYLSGSGSSTLAFRYTVASGDLDNNGVSVGSALELNGATIRNLSAADASVTLHNVASTLGVLVDAVGPWAAAVTAPASATYKAGQTLSFAINFSEPVMVNTTGGMPTLSLALNNGGAVTASYVSGSGGTTLNFSYTVQAGQEDLDGISLNPSLALNGATLRDASGNAATVNIPSVNTSGVKVDARPPTVSSIVRQSPTSSSTSASTLKYRVTFSEGVSGVDSSDFHLTTTGSANATVSSVSEVAANLYDVTVSVTAGNGTVRLDLSNPAGVNDLVSNAMTAAFSAGEIFDLIANRAPTFVSGGDVSVPNNVAISTKVNWATSISAGALDEIGQTLAFTITTDNPTLFASAPTLSPEGTLVIKPAVKASGSATATVTLKDDGGIVDGGVDISVPVTFKIAVTTYKEETGLYNGLAKAAPSTTPSNDRVGALRVSIGSKGAFTGLLTLAGVRYPLAGKVDEAGAFSFGKAKTAYTATRQIMRKNKTPLTLALQLDVSAGSDTLSGTLTDANQPFATLSADRALYSAAKVLKAPYLSVPKELLGTYTVVLAAKSPTAQGLPASDFPQGDGIGALRVSASGVVRLTGTLADGTPIACSSALSKTNTWPLYVSLAKGTGSISAPVRFFNQTGVSDLDASDVLWFKAAVSGATYYANGWPTGIKTNLLGSKFIAPGALKKINPFTGLTMLATTLNAGVTLEDGGLTTALQRAFTVSQAAVITIPDRGPEQLSLTMLFPYPVKPGLPPQPGTFANGLFNGSFVHPVSQARTKFMGVVFQKQQTGFGFFLGSSQSGAVTLAPR